MNSKMRSKMYWLAALLIAILAIEALQHARAANPQNVRQAAVAGGFYPADPKTLSAMIDDMLAHASPPPIDGQTSLWLHLTPGINSPAPSLPTLTRR